MIKNRSKPKPKSSTSAELKKLAQQKPRKSHKLQDKQNCPHMSAKLSMTAVQSRKKLKPTETETERAISPLQISKHKNVGRAPMEDEKFIEKLFQSNMSRKDKSKNYFVEQLIEGLLPGETRAKTKSSTFSHDTSGLLKQLSSKNDEIIALQHEIQQLKLYVSNFTFKVFDLTVLCRKYSSKLGHGDENNELTRKTDEVIAYLDSLVRHWRLEDKIRTHCELISKQIYSTLDGKLGDFRKRCHTESLKIPIEDYLESLQGTVEPKIAEAVDYQSRRRAEDESSEQIMRILSRRSSGVKRQQEEFYIATKNYEPKNQHELPILPGERISVLQKPSAEKWLGFKDGKVGYFPKDCLI